MRCVSNPKERMKDNNNFILSGKYEILKPLGCGSNGTVYLARHQSLGIDRAIKFFPKNAAQSPFAISEAQVLKTVQHPGIPTIYDFEEDESFYYLVEEYIQGDSLEQFLLHQPSISRVLFYQFCEQLCDIFSYLHTLCPSPILYQDLKPEHIIVCGLQIKLIDFSVASFITNSGNDFNHFGNADFSAPELDVYARLTENQLVNRADPANALFIAESPLVIGRALDAGCVPVSFLMEPQHITGKGAEILTRCDPDIPVYTAPLDVLTQLTGFHLTRGMLCAMRRPPLPTLDEVCAGARRIAVLENVMNPTNLGAIFRCAAALGMDAVLLTSAGSDPLYRRAVRVSMGTVFQVPWTYLEDENSWPEQLHALGFKTAAMALREDSVRLDDPRLLAEEKLAIVLGTEGDGLAADTIAHCDYTVRIPMSHGVDSLNVASASAVAFYQLGLK